MLFKKIFFIKFRRVVNILIKNLTRCKVFSSKSDALEKILRQNLSSFETFSPRSDLYLVCQVLTER